MKSKPGPSSLGAQAKLFEDSGQALVDFIDRKNSLVRLADSIQWEIFEDHWRGLFSTAGSPMANSDRRVAGLLMLKHREALSDKRLMQVWVTNPYFQYFYGETHFQHCPPADPTSLIRGRKRLDEEGMEWLLTSVVESAVSSDLQGKGTEAL